MPDPLLATKVSLPLLRHPFVPRPEILTRLSAGLREDHLLTLISAPAGYGKTTTLRLWLEELSRPVAWVRLDKTDNEPSQFLTYVLTALQRSVENLGRTALEAVESAPDVNLPQVLRLLINDVHALAQPMLLVLDDYHLIENPAIDGFIDALLQQALPTLHLVITTREDPGLSLARLRVKHQLTEIRAADLRFSLEEASEFFTQVMAIQLSAQQVDTLEQRTEGWVAGLQLAAVSLKVRLDPEAFVERVPLSLATCWIICSRKSCTPSRRRCAASCARRPSWSSCLPRCVQRSAGSTTASTSSVLWNNATCSWSAWTIIAPGTAIMPSSLNCYAINCCRPNRSAGIAPRPRRGLVSRARVRARSHGACVPALGPQSRPPLSGNAGLPDAVSGRRHHGGRLV